MVFAKLPWLSRSPTLSAQGEIKESFGNGSGDLQPPLVRFRSGQHIGRLDRHERTGRSRNIAANYKQVIFGVNHHDLLIAYRHRFVPVLAWHPFTLHGPTRISAAAAAAEVSVAFFHAMRGALTGEIVTPHNTGVTGTFARRSDIDGNYLVEHGNRQFLTDREPLDRKPKFANKLLRLAISLRNRLDPNRSKGFAAFTLDRGDVAALAPSCSGAFLIKETDLHGFVAILRVPSEERRADDFFALEISRTRYQNPASFPLFVQAIRYSCQFRLLILVPARRPDVDPLIPRQPFIPNPTLQKNTLYKANRSDFQEVVAVLTVRTYLAPVLILMSTPAGRTSLFSASMVRAVA